MLYQLFFQVKEWFSFIETKEEGQGLVEYALIIALVAIVLVAILGTMTDALDGIFEAIANALNVAAAPNNT